MIKVGLGMHDCLQICSRVIAQALIDVDWEFYAHLSFLQDEVLMWGYSYILTILVISKYSSKVRSTAVFVWFGSLRSSQQLCSCRDGQFT